jgi:hypothetical protein
MAVAEQIARRPRTYGNWRRPASPGLLGMGALGTTILFVGLVSLIIAWFTGGVRATAPIALLLAGALVLLAFRDRHSATAAERLGRWLAWVVGRRRGLHLYRSARTRACRGAATSCRACSPPRS